MAKTIVLLTIHGMGFQQAPLKSGTPGYADGLHERLSRHLGHDLLSDDPQRATGRRARGERGPIYVHSQWPPNSHQIEHGMSRLGSWLNREKRQVDASDREKYGLVEEDRRIAHVALVYADLKDTERHLASLAEGGLKAAINLDEYSTIGAFVRDRFLDIRAMFMHPAPRAGERGAELQVRRNPDPETDSDAYEGPTTPPEPFPPAEDQGGLLEVVGQLEKDVTTYLARNDHRERVRSFVRDALMRLCFRDDVAAVVVNAHSLGTVVAFDALRALPPHAACWVRGLVTAGSPLRKFATLYQWGNEARGIAAMNEPGTWLNFWDPRDPVADPLALPQFWQRGEEPPVPDEEGRYRVPERDRVAGGESTVPGFFEALNEVTGRYAPVTVRDRAVDNVAHSGGGGLKAHNYWGNEAEVVPPLADLLREVVRAVDGA